MTGVNLLSQESIGSKILWLRQEKVLLARTLRSSMAWKPAS